MCSKKFGDQDGLILLKLYYKINYYQVIKYHDLNHKNSAIKNNLFSSIKKPKAYTIMQD